MRKSRLFALGITILALAVAGWSCSGSPEMKEHSRKLVVLGFDGMSPILLDQWIDENGPDGQPLLPNFRKLRDEGTYTRLGTTNPPESPVAWASFNTGRKPGNHGIYDFLARDPQTYYPEMAGLRREKPEFLWKTIPIKAPVIESTISGKWFWEYLGENQVGTVAFQIPMTFPVRNTPGTYLFAGLNIPDMRGTQGTFHFFSTGFTDEQLGSVEMGGILRRPEAEDGRRYKALMDGPPDPTADEYTIIKEPVYFTVDPQRKEVLVELQGEEVTIKEGEWSDFMRVSFTITPLVKVHGIVRFYVLRADDQLEVYLGPVEWNPERPPAAFTAPKNLSRELAENVGLFKTRGWAIDTAALQEEKIDEAAMLRDAWFVMDKRTKLAEWMYDNKDWSLYMASWAATDRVSHMFYRLLDTDSPRHDPDLAQRYGDAILQSYQKADEIVGTFRGKIAQEETPTSLIIMSDHGFHPYNKSFNINTWLVRNGYMYFEGQYSRDYILDDLFGDGDFFENVDWTRTKAYALGLGQIYINLKGRERDGIVDPSEYDALCREIREKMLAYRDDNNYNPVANIYLRDEVYEGSRIDDAPDMQVGFNRGYRVSWQTCLGGVPLEITEDNTKKWSGDHCSVDATITAGIMLTDMDDLDLSEPFIYDLGPTILDLFGQPVPEDMDGKSLLKPDAVRAAR